MMAYSVMELGTLKYEKNLFVIVQLIQNGKALIHPSWGLDMSFNGRHKFFYLGLLVHSMQLSNTSMLCLD